MKDNYGREIYYLRISVTEACNLQCVYCVPENGEAAKTSCKTLSVDEIAEIVRAAAACGVTKVRVTGGEPLLRPDIVEICRQISDTPGISELCITTNGILLTKHAAALKAAGVNRLNISLDSLDPETYKKITRNGTLESALAGLRAAIDTGFDALKINAVLLGGVNDKEVRQLLDMTLEHRVNVRFIEFMPIGESADWNKFISTETVLDIAPELEDIGVDGVARLYRLPGGLGTVGLISPISSHFCPTCNKIRVSSDGKLKPCLHTAEEIDLCGLSGGALETAIRNAVLKKPQQHELTLGEISPAQRNMNAIGG